MDILIIFVTTFIATLLSSMSGGGASIINLPIFLFLGMSLPLAVAIQKVSSAFWFLPAAYNYLKDRKVDWVFLFLFAALGLIGAYLGVLFIVSINQRPLELGIGLLILFLVIYTYFQKEIGILKEKTHSPLRQVLAYPFAIVLGFYESIFGAGNGILLAIVTFYTRGFDFINALGYYFSVGFFWAVFAAILLTQKGYYNIELTIPAIAGSVLGGYVGSKYAKYKGNRFIKLIFMIVGLILGIKLVVGL